MGQKITSRRNVAERKAGPFGDRRIRSFSKTAISLAAFAMLATSRTHAAPANSLAVGLMGSGGYPHVCLSSDAGGVLSADTYRCDGGGGFGAGVVAYDAAGAWGAYSIVTGPDAVRLGVTGMDRFTITANDGINAFMTMSLNFNKITNVAPGTVSPTSMDAVNGSQLYGLSTSTSTMVTSLSTGIDTLSTSTSTAVGSLSTGLSALYTDVDSLSVGVANSVQYDAQDHRKVTLGGVDAAEPVTLTNVAPGAVSDKSLDAVNGAQLHALGASAAKALGGGASVNGDGSIAPPAYAIDGRTFDNVGDALGNLDTRVTTIDTTLNNFVAGGGIKYFHSNSALPDSVASGSDAVAIGGNAHALAAGSVAIGSNSVADRANAVSVGAAGAQRQITNVAPGTADTDAVNVAQMKAAQLIDADGSANAAVVYDHRADGTTDFTSVTLGNGQDATTIHNVAAGIALTDAVNVAQMNDALGRAINIAGSAQSPFVAADGNRDTEAARASGTHATAIGANANASAANSVALGADSVADRASTVSVGAAGSERQITNIAAGTQETDAVNVRQLNLAAAQAQDYADTRIAGVQQQLNDIGNKAWGGIASAMAVAGLPQPTAPGKTMVALAGSHFSGATGTAIGVSYVTRDARWVVKMSGNTSSYGNVGVVVGSGYQW